jgi:hypothetical protein
MGGCEYKHDPTTGEEWCYTKPATAAHCRNDICTDEMNDCCAPGLEPRGCSEEGYFVFPIVSTAGNEWAEGCGNAHGLEAAY